MKLGIIESTPCMTATKETRYYWKHIVYESYKRNWVLLRAHRVWQQQKKWVLRAQCVWEQQKKLGIIQNTLCMTATKKNGYWGHNVYKSNKRNWVLLTAHCVWEQKKKLGIIENTMCMTATAETGCNRQHAVYDSNWWNSVLQQALCLWENAWFQASAMK